MEFNGTFLATIVTFIVFVFVMNKVLYAPILGIMEERKAFIDSNYNEAKTNDEKSASLVQEREEKLDEAKDTAREKYLESVDKYKSKRTEQINSVQNEVRNELEQSKEELKHLSDSVKDELKGRMTNLASDIVEKVIGYRSEVQDFDNEVVSSVLWEGVNNTNGNS